MSASFQSLIAVMIAIVSSIVAIASLFVSVLKHRAEFEQSKDMRARNAWDSYLKLAFENPDLTYFQGAPPLTKKRYEQYEFFVYRFLMAADEVLRCFPKSDFWKRQVQSQINFHSDYFLDWRPNDWIAFGPSLQKLAKELGPTNA